MKKALICITLLILIITACSPEAQATASPANVEDEPTPTPVEEEQTPPAEPEERTPAQQAAVEAFSESLGVPPDEITVVSTEAVEWPDGCLGIQEEGLACTEVITPGFRVVLDANGRQVEYRTNEDGTQIRPATVAMTWKREGGIAGFCDAMTVYLSGEVHVGSCKQGKSVEGRLSDLLSEEEMEKLDEWLTAYGSITIDASDPKGVADRMVVMLMLIGTGSQSTLSGPAKQELITFAQELHQRLYR